jgi:hypothetical protein
VADEPNPFVAWGRGGAPAAPPSAPPQAPPAPPPAAQAHRADLRVTAARLVLCAVLAGGVAAALVLGLGGSAPPVLKTLRAATFATTVPAGYAVVVTHPLAGFDTFRLLSAPGAGSLPIVDGGVPPAGVVELTLSEVPAAVASTAAHNPQLETLAPMKLLGLLVKPPRGASQVLTPVRLHRATLGGAPAAAISYSYSYRGRANLRSAIVTRHGTQLVGVELDSGAALAAKAAAAEQTVLANWAWSAPAPS